MPIIRVHGGSTGVTDAVRGAVTAGEEYHQRFKVRKQLELQERALAAEIDQSQKLQGLRDRQFSADEEQRGIDNRVRDRSLEQAEQNAQMERERRATLDQRNTIEFEQEQADRQQGIEQEEAERGAIIRNLRAMGASRPELEQAAQLPIARLRTTAAARQLDNHAKTQAMKVTARAKRLYGQGVFGEPSVDDGQGEPGQMPQMGPAEERLQSLEADLKARPETADQVDALLNDVEREHIKKAADMSRRAAFVEAEVARIQPIAQANPGVYADMMLAANHYADGTIDQQQYQDEMSRGYWLNNYGYETIREMTQGSPEARMAALTLVDDVHGRVITPSDASKAMRAIQMGLFEVSNKAQAEPKSQSFEIPTGGKSSRQTGSKPTMMKVEIPGPMMGNGRALSPEDVPVMEFYSARAREVLVARGTKKPKPEDVDELAYQLAQQYGGWR